MLSVLVAEDCVESRGAIDRTANRATAAVAARKKFRRMIIFPSR
jgi:hypothetical protein